MDAQLFWSFLLHNWWNVDILVDINNQKYCYSKIIPGKNHWIIMDYHGLLGKNHCWIFISGWSWAEFLGEVCGVGLRWSTLLRWYGLDPGPIGRGCIWAALLWHNAVYYIILYCTILYFIILYHIILYFIIVCYFIFYYIMWFFIILYHIILYYIIMLYYIKLYYIILCYIILVYIIYIIILYY